jgi:hypothetical protein
LKSNHQSLYSLNKNQNQSKTVAKAKKTSAKQMEQAGDCISQQCSAVLNLQLISRFLAFFDRVRVKDVRTKPTEVAQNPSKIEKTLRMLLKCLLVSSFKMNSMGMIAKTAELKPIKNCGKSHENFSKTNGKRLGIAFLGSAQQCSLCN